MLYFMMYLLTGVIAVSVMSAGHLISAELKGYEAIKWWDENEPFGKVWSSTSKVDLITGLLIWPVRVVYGCWVLIPEWYEQYDRKISNDESLN